MTATAAINGSYQPVNEHDAIPAFTHRKLGASAQVGRGQFVTVSLSTGYAALNDGTVPNQAACGVGDPSNLSDTSSTAGLAMVRLSQRWFKGVPASTVSLDSFLDTDYGVPFFIADENTPGKKSNNSGSNRSLGGLVFGLGDDSNPVVWDGPVAWLIARSTLITQAVIGASHSIATTAGTDTAEAAMTRQKFHGVVTAVEYVGAAIAADNTDYVTVTISKRDGAGGSAATVATYDSRAANQGAATAFVPMAFALSGTAANLNLLETDVLTITVAHGGAGKAITGSFRVIQKVI